MTEYLQFRHWWDMRIGCEHKEILFTPPWYTFPWSSSVLRLGMGDKKSRQKVVIYSFSTQYIKKKLPLIYLLLLLLSLFFFTCDCCSMCRCFLPCFAVLFGLFLSDFFGILFLETTLPSWKFFDIHSDFFVVLLEFLNLLLKPYEFLLWFLYFYSTFFVHNTLLLLECG